MTLPAGSPPLSSSSSSGHPTLSLRPDSSLEHDPFWSRIASQTNTNRHVPVLHLSLIDVRVYVRKKPCTGGCSRQAVAAEVSSCWTSAGDKPVRFCSSRAETHRTSRTDLNFAAGFKTSNNHEEALGFINCQQNNQIMPAAK